MFSVLQNPSQGCLLSIERERKNLIYWIHVQISPPSSAGLKCFIAYFETVNTNEHRIHRSGSSLVVDKTDLIGMHYLWQLVLKSPYGNIAEEATQYLIDVSFSWLSHKLKKVRLESCTLNLMPKYIHGSFHFRINRFARFWSKILSFSFCVHFHR